jgi:hypothetical protein
VVPVIDMDGEPVPAGDGIGIGIVRDMPVSPGKTVPVAIWLAV